MRAIDSKFTYVVVVVITGWFTKVNQPIVEIMCVLDANVWGEIHL